MAFYVVYRLITCLYTTFIAFRKELRAQVTYNNLETESMEEFALRVDFWDFIHRKLLHF